MGSASELVGSWGGFLQATGRRIWSGGEPWSRVQGRGGLRCSSPQVRSPEGPTGPVAGGRKHSCLRGWWPAAGGWRGPAGLRVGVPSRFPHVGAVAGPAGWRWVAWPAAGVLRPRLALGCDGAPAGVGVGEPQRRARSWGLGGLGAPAWKAEGRLEAGKGGPGGGGRASPQSSDRGRSRGRCRASMAPALCRCGRVAGRRAAICGWGSAGLRVNGMNLRLQPRPPGGVRADPTPGARSGRVPTAGPEVAGPEVASGSGRPRAVASSCARPRAAPSQPRKWASRAPHRIRGMCNGLKIKNVN